MYVMRFNLFVILAAFYFFGIKGEVKMKEDEKLKNKWKKLAQNNKAGHYFDYEQVSPGKFCVHKSDEGGQMTCSVHIEITGFFESKNDALAYFRFAEIPRILDWDCGLRKENITEDAEFYLSKYKYGRRKKIENLLKLIDNAIFGLFIEAKKQVKESQKD